jgi:protein-S-isoprenylcysteine O-methyltransferase Ste14
MLVIRLVFAVVWAAFWLYWLIAAFSMTAGRPPWGRELGIRVVVAGLVIVLYRLGVFRHPGPRPGLLSGVLGLLLLIPGLGFAVWARRHLGRNWGMPMTQKRQPELVTSGPYRFVRHPIYSGLLLAVLGTALALGRLWLIAVALATLYFVYSATVEEHYMSRRFPDVYPAYRRSTKMLVPFVW